MSDLLTFFDVETPNRRNDRVCSIAVVQTDPSGLVVERRSWLVDPEARFDDINIRIHGIAPVSVRQAKTLPELWEDELRPLISGTRLVAHNAKFDLCVLSKAFEAYGILVGRPTYADTMEMARAALSDVPDVKLPTVCARLGVELQRHHKAEADAEACRGVFWSLADPKDLDRHFSLYVYSHPMPRERPRAERSLSARTRDMAELVRLLSGVVSDGSVSVDEAMGVLLYVVTHESLADDPTVSEVADAIQAAVSDGDLDAREADDLESLFARVVDPASAESEEHSDIEFEGRKFVLTGNFEHGSKDDVERFITERGGLIAGKPSGKVSYVVVGGCGSEAYAMGSYGTKVKKAMDLQAKGAPIQIIQECELYGEARP
ncbi:MAG: exonuclease domain-containing protein [Atopobiaceae bacterium]|nr:exonuclease domain-containing protein [Atopobiaceae bacterium]